MMNPRISGNESLMTMIQVMSEGNPGAVKALFQMVSTATNIDPDSMLGPMGPIIALDTAEIYGSKIWMLYSDICNLNDLQMQTVLRACQLGIISRYDIHDAIEGKRVLDLGTLLQQVQAELPNFGKTAVEG